MLAEVQCRVSTERNNLKQVSRRAVTSKARSVHRERADQLPLFAGSLPSQTQLVVVWVSHVLLALLVGRSTCLRSGPWGLALCGGPLGSRQTFPFGRQLPCKRLGRVKVTDYFNI